MKDVAKKALKTGYGLGLLSLAEGKKVAFKLKKDLNLSEDECVKLAKALVVSSKKASEEVVNTVTKHMEKVVVKTGLASKREVKMVKKVVKGRIKRLGKESALSKVKRKVKTVSRKVRMK